MIYFPKLSFIMSTAAVDTSASSVGFGGSGVLAGVGVVAAAGCYFLGVDGIFDSINVSKITLVMSIIIMAIVLWLMLTDIKKFGSLVTENQLVAIVLACVVGLEVLLHGYMVVRSRKTDH